MRKSLALLAVLALCASPLKAQQSAQSFEAAPAVESRQPTLAVSTAEVRQQVVSNEARLNRQHAQVGNRDWWYLVAAIAVGVIIAALVL